MELAERLRGPLVTIDFVRRYRSLAAAARGAEPYLSAYDSAAVVALLRELGRVARYDRRESFFKIVEEVAGFRFQLNISIKYGIVELIWDVLEGGQRLSLGGPWGLVCALIDENVGRIPPPNFRSYEELRAIVREALTFTMTSRASS